jgi:hypothetical protein
LIILLSICSWGGVKSAIEKALEAPESLFVEVPRPMSFKGGQLDEHALHV